MGKEREPLKIQRGLGAPLHHQIYLILREGILSGRHPAGEPLPPEEVLARMFDVSRITVRRALESLDRADLIERQQGRGTFVRADVAPAPLRMPITSVFKRMEALGRHTEARVIEFGYETAPPQVQRMLGVGAVPVQRAVRVRVRKGRPISHLTTWVPKDVGRTFTAQDMAATPLYRLVRRAGVLYVRGRQTISAALADPIVAARLDVQVGAPLLDLRRQVFDQSDRVVEYLEFLASPENFQLHMLLDGPDLSPAEVQPE